MVSGFLVWYLTTRPSCLFRTQGLQHRQPPHLPLPLMNLESRPASGPPKDSLGSPHSRCKEGQPPKQPAPSSSLFPAITCWVRAMLRSPMASALAWAFTRMALASPERERQAQGSLRWPHPGGLSSQVPRPAPQRAFGLRPSCRGRGEINRSSFPLPREEWVQRRRGRRPGPSINQAQHSWSRPLGRSL